MCVWVIATYCSAYTVAKSLAFKPKYCYLTCFTKPNDPHVSKVTRLLFMQNTIQLDSDDIALEDDQIQYDAIKRDDLIESLLRFCLYPDGQVRRIPTHVHANQTQVDDTSHSTCA